MVRGLLGVGLAGLGLAVAVGQSMAGAMSGAMAGAMPVAVTGLWRVVRVLPTRNEACWDQAQARAVVGTTLRYREGMLTWKGTDYPIHEALTRTLSGNDYLTEYKVRLGELGIRAEMVTEVDLQHEDADVTGATTEVPGDTIVLAGPGRIVVSACGVFYEAVRVRAGR